MILFRKIDITTGMFIEDVLFDSHPFLMDDEENPTPDPRYIAEPVPPGFYWPKWDGDKWVEGGEAPEPIVPEPTEIEKLEAKINAASEYTDFLEEVIVEMAQAVYG